MVTKAFLLGTGLQGSLLQVLRLAPGQKGDQPDQRKQQQGWMQAGQQHAGHHQLHRHPHDSGGRVGHPGQRAALLAQQVELVEVVGTLVVGQTGHTGHQFDQSSIDGGSGFLGHGEQHVDVVQGDNQAETGGKGQEHAGHQAPAEVAL